MNPQVAERVVGKDRKVYTVSTMRYRYDLFKGEIWETAVFEGKGCLTLGRTQRYTDWTFDPGRAEEAHAEAVGRVRNEPPEHWIMDAATIKQHRKGAIDSFESPADPKDPSNCVICLEPATHTVTITTGETLGLCDRDAMEVRTARGTIAGDPLTPYGMYGFKRSTIKPIERQT